LRFNCISYYYTCILTHRSSDQYVLLTGVYPIYDECHESNVKKYIKEGIIPWIDPRWAENSFAEAELSKVIKDCWAYEPKDRPSIGELVVRLRKAEEENRGSERK